MHRAATHDVFLSYTWADTAKVDELHEALKRRGLRVLRDRDMAVFAPITRTLSDALDDSAVLVAFYSRAYPTRYACQWELTRAFLSARSRGHSPETRVLVINPEGDEKHVEPVQLTDQAFGRWPYPGGVDALADRVAGKVDATGRTRMGPPEPADPAAVGVQFAKNEWFAGRYAELWRVHSALTQGGLPVVRDPHPRSVVLVKAIAGLGKSALARRYGFLFGQGYPGGMFWTELHGGGQRSSGKAMLENYRTRVAENHGMPLLEIDELRVLLARRFDEAVELFRRYWADMNDADARAVAGLAEQVGGHPLTLGTMAHELRGAQGTDLAARVLGFDGTAEKVLTTLVRGLGSSTRLVLSYAAVLSQAPFTTDLVTSGLADFLNEAAVADALSELRDHSLVRAAYRQRQAWQVHALVAAVAVADTPERMRGQLAVKAAGALISRLDHPLHHLARSTRGRVYVGEGRYERAREVFEDLLPRQVAAIGRDHPDALVTQFDLAIHLLLAEPRQRGRAVRLLDDVHRRQGAILNWWQDDHLKTVVAKYLAVLPGGLWRLFGRYYRP